jgi:hypothetical protein
MAENFRDTIFYVMEGTMKKSEYLSTYLKGVDSNFTFKEVLERTINLPEDDPEAVRQVLLYLDPGKLKMTLLRETPGP